MRSPCRGQSFSDGPTPAQLDHDQTVPSSVSTSAGSGRRAGVAVRPYRTSSSAARPSGVTSGSVLSTLTMAVGRKPGTTTGVEDTDHEKAFSSGLSLIV